MTKSIDDLLYRIEFTYDNMKPKFLREVIDCIKTLVNERAELREQVEFDNSMDTWISIAEKYGWE